MLISRLLITPVAGLEYLSAFFASMLWSANENALARAKNSAGMEGYLPRPGNKGRDVKRHRAAGNRGGVCAADFVSYSEFHAGAQFESDSIGRRSRGLFPERR
jgi:hypothetical protein